MPLKRILGNSHIPFQPPPEPLTHGHFLIGRTLPTLPQTKVTVPQINEHQIMKIRKYFDSNLETVEYNYMLELKSAHQHQQVDQPSKLKENTVVLIKDSTPQLI